MIGNFPQPFGDRLATLVEERESQLVLGLDPDPANLWPGEIETGGGDGEQGAGIGAGPAAAPPGRPDDDAGDAASLAALAVARHCRTVIAAVGDQCVGVKFQLACFERLGAPGWWALADAVTAAREQGLIAIADGKRGDVPVSASVYGEALFGPVATPWGDASGLGADAITANALLGADSLEPLLEAASNSGGGVFALVRTSNPGAIDIEDLPVEGGGTVSDRLAALVGRLGAESAGESGLSSLGAVVGATAPEHIARLRDAMPHAVFLIPGVGAQGGRVEDLSGAFSAGRASALVTVSRALVGAGTPGATGSGGHLAQAARDAAADLRERIWSASG